MAERPDINIRAYTRSNRRSSCVLSVQSVLLVLLFVLSPGTAIPIHADTHPNNSDPASYGAIYGNVYDAETHAPIIGASVFIEGTTLGDATDSLGQFSIEFVPIGGYSVVVRSLSYRPVTKTDIIVRPDRISFVDVGQQLMPIPLRGMQVRAGYFPESDLQASSGIGFSAEEIRRTPGAAGDISRMILGLPSIGKVNDIVNSLVVRGGNPFENAFYLDNIEIPNINHFPIPGSTGGPIGLLNVDFIEDVQFSAGGFPVEYGNRLSSVMDISFRDGNREEFDAQLDASLAGFGFVAEGPLVTRRGSWMAAARRGYLDLLVDAMGGDLAPRFSDYQSKITYDLSATNNVSVLGVRGDDYVEFTKEQAEVDGNSEYYEYDGFESAVGATWRFLWNADGYSVTSLSHIVTNGKSAFFETDTDSLYSDQDFTESALQLRNVNHYRFGSVVSVRFGAEGQYLDNDYDYTFGNYLDQFGYHAGGLDVDRRITATTLGTFASVMVSPIRQITGTLGLRYDESSLTDRHSWSPRISITYRLSDRFSIHGINGVYHQSLPVGLIAQYERNQELRSPVSVHRILGLGVLLQPQTRLLLEAYHKRYKRFPMDRGYPTVFIADEVVDNYFFGSHPHLVDRGSGEAYGIEATLQKRLVAGIYGLIGAAYSRSHYKDLYGTWRNRSIENRLRLTLEGGYKPNDRYEFSFRWLYAGGQPYTPINSLYSRLGNRTIREEEDVNLARYPAYHSLNVRVDRRFNFHRSSLIVYVSIWNAYDHKNVAYYYWNRTEKKLSAIYQWRLLPILGFEYEF